MRLNETWTDWFDTEVWQVAGGNEFNQPVSPAVLTEPRPDFIWPGFMLPDTLPVLGNKYGDWLCLRVGPNDEITEVIHWYHGGGDWIPWGSDLAEAIAFDVIRMRMPGRRISHAIRPDQQTRRDGSTCPHLLWAQQHAAAKYQPLLNAERSNPHGELADVSSFTTLADNPAVAASLILHALDSEFRRRVQPDTSRRLGIAWEPTIVMWMFDTDRASTEAIEAVRRRGDGPDSDLLKQDWDTAAQLAQRITQSRHDLGWAWDIAGWSAEREGDLDRAVAAYQAGVQASAFADQSIRFRTHWFPETFGKFTAFRLHELSKTDQLPFQASSYLETLWDQQSDSVRRRITDYWQRRADEHAAAGDYARVYDDYYCAGWDMGLQDLTGYRELLEKLADAAAAAGQPARAEVARTHLRCLTG